MNAIKKIVHSILYGNESQHSAWEFPGVKNWPVPTEHLGQHDPLRPAPVPITHHAA
jgi:hypothetical protein